MEVVFDESADPGSAHSGEEVVSDLVVVEEGHDEDWDLGGVMTKAKVDGSGL